MDRKTTFETFANKEKIKCNACRKETNKSITIALQSTNWDNICLCKTCYIKIKE